MDDFSAEARAEMQQDDDVFDATLMFAEGRAAGPVAGFYGPDSLTWRVYREPAVILGGLRAIILQLAHPAIAAGVSQNSDFRNDLLGRARRTFLAMYQLIFGDLKEARGAAKRLHNVHNRVRGTIDGNGVPYRANDPVLLQWVLATLVDTAFVTYERLVQPLTPDERARLYEESRISAGLSGIPQRHYPATLDLFYDYYDGMLHGPQLRVGATGRDLADALFRSPVTRHQLDELLTVGWLPPHIRDRFGLAWDDRRQQRHERLLDGIGRILRRLPDGARCVPAYHQAHLRLAQAEGRPLPVAGRFWNGCDHRLRGLGRRLGRDWDLPLSIRALYPGAPQRRETPKR